MVKNEINKFVRSISKDLFKAMIKGTIKEKTLVTAARIYSGTVHYHEDEVVKEDYEAAMKAKLHIELLDIPQESVLDVLKNFDEDMNDLKKALKAKESKSNGSNDTIGIMNVRMY